MVPEHARPHDARKRAERREERAEVGADHGGIERGGVRLPRKAGHDRGKQHAHGDVVDEVCRKEGGYAIACDRVRAAKERADAAGQAVFIEREHQHEHGKDEGDDLPRRGAERIVQQRKPLPPAQQVQPGQKKEAAKEREADEPHRQVQVRGENEQHDAQRKVCHAEAHEHRVLRRFFGHGMGDAAAQHLAEQQREHAEGGKPRKECGQQHYGNIAEKAHVCRRGEVDIRRVADDERHAPGVRGNEFAYEVGDWVDLRIPCEIADERREREHDDVVGGEHRQHGYKRIEQGEQPELARVLPLKHGGGQVAEEACAIEKDGDQRHRKEQHEDLERVDAVLRREPCEHLPRGDRAKKQQNGRADERHDPENVDGMPLDPHRGFCEHDGNKRRAGHGGNSSHKVHNDRLLC